MAGAIGGRDAPDPTRPSQGPEAGPQYRLRGDISTVPGALTLTLALDDQSLVQLADLIAARLGTTTSMSTDQWLDSRAASVHLGMHRDTLRKLAAARLIPSEQGRAGLQAVLPPGATLTSGEPAEALPPASITPGCPVDTGRLC